MIDPGLARRYARALFFVTEERSVSHEVDVQFKKFCTLYRENPRLGDFLSTPRIPPAEKERVLRSVLEGLVDPTLRELLLLLRRKRRLALVYEVADAYHGIVDESRNETTAKVTTAVAMNDEERGRLKHVLEKRSGKTVELEEAVDPRVIGGARVVLEGKLIDDTIAHHLSVLREQLHAVPVQLTAE